MSFFNGNSGNNSGEINNIKTQLADIAIEKPNVLNKYLYPRLKNLGTLLRHTPVPKGVIFGDSIAEGAGASEAGNIWYYKLGSKLSTKFGNTTNNWTPMSYGVGGQTLFNILPYISHIADGDTRPKIKKGFAYDAPYWIFCTGVNDALANIDISVFSKLYRNAVRNGIKNGIDVICIIENPTIDRSASIGSQIVNNGFTTYRSEIRRIALEEGATLIDHYGYMEYLSNKGVDLVPYYYDTVHPSDAGHSLLADLIYWCLTQFDSAECTPITNNSSSLSDNEIFFSQFNAKSLVNAAIVTVSGYVASGTSRKSQLKESSISAIEIQQGGSCVFEMPLLNPKNVFITHISKSDSGIYSLINPKSQNVITNVSTLGSLIREKTNSALPGFTLDNINDGSYKITATSGTVLITGITFQCDKLVSKHEVIKGNEIGTWSNTNNASKNFRTSSTVGDTIEVYWYGTSLAVEIERYNYAGIVGLITDNLPEVVYDAYAGIVRGATRTVLHGTSKLTKGWHKTIISVKTKNPSSLGNIVSLGDVHIYCDLNNNGDTIAMLNSGIDCYLPENYNFISSTDGVPKIKDSNQKITSSTQCIIEAKYK